MTSETVADVLAEMRNSGWPSNAENWADRIDRALRGAEAVAWITDNPMVCGGGMTRLEQTARLWRDQGFNVVPLIAAPPAPAASVPVESLDAPGYGLSAEQIAMLLSEGLKPEEIGGTADVQHARVGELVRWFARLATKSANPKWAVSHAFELAYFVATNAGNRHIDLKPIREAAYKDGAMVSPADRGMLERIGFLPPMPAEQVASAPDAAANPAADAQDEGCGACGDACNGGPCRLKAESPVANVDSVNTSAATCIESGGKCADAQGVEAFASEIGAKGSPANEQDRLAFEAWMRGHCWVLCATWRGEQYKSDAEDAGRICPDATRTRMMWAAWRDRGELARRLTAAGVNQKLTTDDGAQQPNAQAGERKRRVFVDMDGVIVDFDAYKVANGMTGDEVKRTPGAYLAMPAIPGAIEAVRSVIGMGYEVWIATKPPTGVPYAYSDKAAWILQHLPELKRRIIVTHDKGLLGDARDFLCDDRPHKANCERFAGTLLRFVDEYHWPQALAELSAASRAEGGDA